MASDPVEIEQLIGKANAGKVIKFFEE
jgi:hypothetical protein